jgi:hypothetical protein
VTTPDAATPADPQPAKPQARGVQATTLAGIVVLSGFAAWQALRFGLWDGREPGPGLFPLAAAVLTGLLALGAMVVCLRRAEDPPPPARSGPDGKDAVAPEPWAGAIDAPGEAIAGGAEHRRVAVYIAALALWAVALPWAGFGLTSLVALGAILRLAERQTWRLSLGVSGAAVLVGWLVFERLLGVPLPHGPGLPF